MLVIEVVTWDAVTVQTSATTWRNMPPPVPPPGPSQTTTNAATSLVYMTSIYHQVLSHGGGVSPWPLVGQF